MYAIPFYNPNIYVVPLLPYYDANDLILGMNNIKVNVKRTTFLENLSCYFTEYCNNTSIHGLKFLGERRRPFVEKIWWSVFLAISLYFCVTFIRDTYQKWEKSPVIVTFATTETPIWKIPFPSVTICPEIKSRKSVYNYTDEVLWTSNVNNNSSLNRDRLKKYDYMNLLCPSLFHSPYLYDNVTTTLDDADNFIGFFVNVAPFFEDIFYNVRWLNSDGILYDDNLEKQFPPVLTSEGICYSFNILDSDEIYTNDTYIYKSFGSTNRNRSNWTVARGYENDADLNTFPRRTLMSGVAGGLDIIFSTKKLDIDPLCGDSVHGYKIILQHPTEIPRGKQKYFRVPLNQNVVAAIKPKMMTTADDLKHYHPEDRQCYFFEEKKLKFFKIYNQHNCLMECLANFSYNHCDCVAFYMPRDNSTPVCGPTMSSCISTANAIFLSKEVAQKLSGAKQEKNKKRQKVEANENCNCLPSCRSIEYDTETSQSDWDWATPMEILNFPRELNEAYHYSRLRIFFADMQFITSERNQLYGNTDFLANCGGLLGLFTGFSFISIVEILYFITLRFMCNLRKYGRYYWPGSEELAD